MVLAKVLATIKKTPLQDQIGVAKGAWGIVADQVSDAEASILVQALGSAGVDAISIPATSMIPLPDRETAKTWAQVSAAPPLLIAAAAITVTSITTKTVKEGPSGAQKMLNTAILLGTGLPIKLGGKERIVQKTQEQSDRVFFMDLYYANPLRRLRVEADQFDYSFLKERKLYQVLGNFKLLLGDCVRQAPSSWKNHGARVLLEGKPMMTMGYASLADLDRESRWLLTLMKEGLAG